MKMLLNSFEKLQEHLDLMLSKLKKEDYTKFLEKVDFYVFKVNLSIQGTEN